MLPYFYWIKIKLKMASNLFRLPIQTIKTPKPSTPLPFRNFSSLNHQEQHQNPRLSFFPHNLVNKSKVLSLVPHSSLSSSYNPPTSKEEAILQARTCLSATLEKPVNNPRLAAGKLMKQKQPRLRVEIPVFDDSDESLTQLAYQIFQDLPTRRKGASIRILILWPTQTLTDLAENLFLRTHSSSKVQNMEISSVTTNNYTRILGSADVAVFLAPDSSQLEIVRAVSDAFYPKPVVVFNPKWGFEEESGFGDLSGFVGSFEVVYSFMGIEVRGLLSKKNAVVFKCVKNGVLSGEGWEVLVEEEGGLKVVSKFKKRPLIGEVESVLYNLMAVNSPITKSVKFLRDIVSSVTGRKRE